MQPESTNVCPLLPANESKLKICDADETVVLLSTTASGVAVREEPVNSPPLPHVTEQEFMEIDVVPKYGAEKMDTVDEMVVFDIVTVNGSTVC